MARYILIEVDDNEAAGDLVQAIERGQGQVFYYTPRKEEDGAKIGNEWAVKELAAKVKALFGKPVKFCDCPSPGDRQVRGAKFGWWVHADCGKPMMGHCQHPRNLLGPEGPTDPKARDLYLGIWEPARER